MDADAASQIFSPSIRTDASGAIDEDIYCLHCGYNLRGLAGDPVCCPECGNLNDLGTAAIPAEMIAKSMRSMETAPTMCAGFAFALVVLASPFLFVARYDTICVLTVAIPATLGWIPFYFRMKRVYENRTGWRGILRDFHIATFCCAAAAPACWFTIIFIMRRQNLPAGLVVAVAVAMAIAAALFVLGLRVYRSAQRRMVSMQHDAAVRMAKEILRRARTWEMARRAR